MYRDLEKFVQIIKWAASLQSRSKSESAKKVAQLLNLINFLEQTPAQIIVDNQTVYTSDIEH